MYTSLLGHLEAIFANAGFVLRGLAATCGVSERCLEKYKATFGLAKFRASLSCK